MLNKLWRKKAGRMQVYTDGAIRPAVNRSGLGAIVLDEKGLVKAWFTKRVGPLTNNEAEYEAVIFALEQLIDQQNAEINLFTDSKVLVDQVRGQAMAHAPGLKKRLARMRTILAGRQRVTFFHIPRKRNRLADALANDVVDGYIPEWNSHV